ncbi:hydrolase, partial [Desulfobacteraceae bacterium SEEP-SAG9]
RNTPGSATGEVNGVQEQLANAAALGAPALACHFNNPGWGLVHELLARYRDRGMNVWGEIYPYAAGGTALNAVFLKPEVWLDQLGHKYEDTLMDPLTNKFFTRATYEEMVKKDPTRIVIVYKMPKEDIVKWLQMPGVTIGSDAMPV